MGRRGYWAAAVAGLLAVGQWGCSSKKDDLEPIHSAPGLEGSGTTTPHGGGNPGGTGSTGGTEGTGGGGTAGGTGGGVGSGGGVGGGTGGIGTVTDGGTTETGGSVVLPSATGWQFYGPQHGGPKRVYGVSADAGGNLWVAGGEEGLFLLEEGAQRLVRFTHEHGLSSYTDSNGVRGYKVISVAGAEAGTVYVGYEGLFAGMEDNDPPYMVTSGDADKVVWKGGTLLEVKHLNLATGPGVDPHYPEGRDKIRSVLRILHDARTGNVWFGGNHGVAMLEARNNRIFEHQHAAIMGYAPNGAYTLYSGDWPGIALDAAGDLWMGGSHRVAKIRYASENRNFWATVQPIVDVWPDAVAVDPKADERTDDHVSDVAVAANGDVWVGSIPNGLARLGSSGTSFVSPSQLVDRKVTALETDPKDGSLWIGHIWSGITRRMPDGSYAHYDFRVFGNDVVSGMVPDIQSDVRGGKRRILVAFESGVVGVYSGD